MSADAPHLWLRDHAARAPHAPALDSPRHRLSYGQLAERVEAFAAALVERGLAPGERVLIALPPSPAAAVAALGTQAAGGCAAEVSPKLGIEGLRAAVRQVGARFAVVAGRDGKRWQSIFAERPPAWRFAVHPAPPPAPLRALLGGARCVHLAEDGSLEVSPAPRTGQVDPAPDAPALILFTSGSTGAPRGVVLSHRNLASNARAIAAYLELTARDRAMLVLPLSYAYGRSVLHAHLAVGGSVFLDDRFMYPRVVLETAAAEGCTSFSGVPATYEVLRRQVPAPPRSASLRLVTQAGGAMSAETTRWCLEAFQPARLFVMYGQTEATARLSYLPPERLAEKLGSIGVPIADTSLQVVDAHGQPLPPHAVGELVARGPGVALGFLDDEAGTTATFRSGWLRTGDLAYRDEDGFFFVVGRAKEMLKIAGHRASPVELEQALARHPAVLEAGVAGAPDPVDGEVPVAFVVARAPTATRELQAHCRSLLPAHLVPRRVIFVDALPRNESGKLLRPRLASLLAAQGAPCPTPTGGLA